MKPLRYVLAGIIFLVVLMVTAYLTIIQMYAGIGQSYFPGPRSVVEQYGIVFVLLFFVNSIYGLYTSLIKPDVKKFLYSCIAFLLLIAVIMVGSLVIV